jgi:hypothetical protein
VTTPVIRPAAYFYMSISTAPRWSVYKYVTNIRDKVVGVRDFIESVVWYVPKVFRSVYPISICVWIVSGYELVVKVEEINTLLAVLVVVVEVLAYLLAKPFVCLIFCYHGHSFCLYV